MTHPIIKTDNYLLITSDEEIKIGDIVLETYVDGTKGLEQIDTLNDIHPLLHKKVIAHLPLNNSPILEGIPLLPPIPNEEDDLDKESDKYAGLIGNKDGTAKFDFKRGYNKAKEKYNITSDKILDLYIEETGYGMDMWSKEENATMLVISKIIDFLSQPKLPVGFKCEMENKIALDGHTITGIEPSIINGVMQGEWIFEELNIWQTIADEDTNATLDTVRKLLEQAKQMEKEQIIKATYTSIITGEDYYNKTYGDEAS